MNGRRIPRTIKGEKTLQEVGGDHFIEFLSRSLIQKSNDDTGGEKFVVLDLVNDLALFVSGKSCCRLVCGDGSFSKYVQHLSYNQEEYDSFDKFEIVYDLECSRSFLPIVLNWDQIVICLKRSLMICYLILEGWVCSPYQIIETSLSHQIHFII